MNYQIEVQEKFDELLEAKFTHLQPIMKWKQTMWHLSGHPVVSLVHLSNKSKFCFFNNPKLKLDKLQRWGTTIYSANLLISQNTNIDWENISRLITDTIKHHDSL